MNARGLLAGLVAILAAAVSVGSAVVRSEAEDPARFSQTIWPNHPVTLRSEAMAQIGLAAARGELPSAETMDRVRLLASRAPLEPDPFLVEAALAQKRGEAARSARLLVEARRRDPRSPGARYLLADQLIRNGDIVEGLKEMTVLSRMVPGAADQLVPGLVAYARMPGAIPKLRRLFRESPDLQPVLLSSLASDAANADLILELAQSSTASSNPRRWRAKLVKSLVDAGMYAKAYQVWARFAGVKTPPSGLFRPDFAPTPEPPPFNWRFAKSDGGFAERSGGALQVVHFGRKKTALASQLMLLPAGGHELSFAVAGDVGTDGQLRWWIRCLPGGATVLDLPLTGSSVGRRVGSQFQVPSTGCTAQHIVLAGVPADMARSSDARISQLQLARVGP